MPRLILTRKIQLLVNTADAEVRKKAWEQLRTWQWTCRRAANYLFTHRFLQEQLNELVYLDEAFKQKLGENFRQYSCSRQNTVYRLLAGYFKGTVPMDMISALNHKLTALYNKERLAFIKGERSLHNFKKNIPIPFAAENMRQFQCSEDGKHYSFVLFGIPLYTYLGRDFSDKRLLLQNFLEGKQKLCTSSLIMEKGKLFWLAAFEYQQQNHALDEATIADVSLSLEHPLSVTIGKKHFVIGRKEEFLYRRLAIQAAIIRVRQQASAARGGKGRKRKLKCLEQYREKEKNYVHNRLHLYSKRLIELCLKHGAGTIVLSSQTAKEEQAKEHAFVLRNWSYGNLKQKIQYKAACAGISLIVE